MKNNEQYKSRGVRILVKEWQEIEKISKKENVTIHSVTIFAVRYFLKHYREGKITELPRKKSTELDKP